MATWFEYKNHPSAQVNITGWCKIKWLNFQLLVRDILPVQPSCRLGWNNFIYSTQWVSVEFDFETSI